MMDMEDPLPGEMSPIRPVADFTGKKDSIQSHPERDELWFEELRKTEYGFLDEQKHTYLDYTGAALASSSQVQQHFDRLKGEVCGNPHSLSPSSLAATRLIDQTRIEVLEHLNASAREYTVIFTSNATGAAKLVGESYPFSPARRLVLTYDNHNSVNGLREYAKRRSCRTVYVPSCVPNLEIDQQKLDKALRRRPGLWRGCMGGESPSGLFVYPAQSNFSGVKHSLEYINLARSRGYDVMLDASAFVPTNALDLRQHHPDFVIMSWYKVFGFPTGVGCLVARKSALQRLKRPWFSGGTIQAVSVGIPWHRLLKDASAFEDGTLNFQSIPDVLDGLRWIRHIGIDNMQAHVQYITAYFLHGLAQLHHSTGSPMSVVYGPPSMAAHGGTVAFNVLDGEGKVVDERIVARESAEAQISIRTGCFCNPGAGEDIFELQVKTLRGLLWARNPTIDEYITLLKLPSAGSVRVSFGIPTVTRDVDRLLEFVRDKYRDRVTSSEGLPPRENC